MRNWGAFFVLFLTAAAAFGGQSAEPSVVKALVARCDLIDDEVVGDAVGKKARLAVLRSIAGQIGPVTYVHHELRKMSDAKRKSEFGVTLSEAAVRRLGAPKVLPPTGKYDSITPDGFDGRVAEWISRTRSGDIDACAELGAASFLDALPKKYSISEEKIYLSFARAAECGNVEAMFMKGVCLYYGIGCTRDRPRAFAALNDWKFASGTKKAVRGRWIARRFAEMKK